MNKKSTNLVAEKSQSFKDLYELKKSELNGLKLEVCTLLGLKESTFYHHMKNNSWSMAHKRLISVWLKAEIEVLFPE